MFNPSSDLYLFHPGYRVVMLNVYTKGSSLTMFKAIAASKTPTKLQDIESGKVGFQIIVPDENDEIDPENEKFILFLFEHRKARKRKRIDIQISPSDSSDGVHTVIKANQELILFEGIIPFGEDTEEFQPFLIPAT